METSCQRRVLETIAQMIYIGKCISPEANMQVAKWGNSLAVRLPKKLVEELGLKEGDNVDVKSAGKAALNVVREEDVTQRKRVEALKRLRATNWKIPPGFKFDREEAHERGWYMDESGEWKRRVRE